jgi:hypothetical protein
MPGEESLKLPSGHHDDIWPEVNHEEWRRLGCYAVWQRESVIVTSSVIPIS